jgi:hypothetical protein
MTTYTDERTTVIDLDAFEGREPNRPAVPSCRRRRPTFDGACMTCGARKRVSSFNAIWVGWPQSRVEGWACTVWRTCPSCRVNRRFMFADRQTIVDVLHGWAIVDAKRHANRVELAGAVHQRLRDAGALLTIQRVDSNRGVDVEWDQHRDVVGVWVRGPLPEQRELPLLNAALKYVADRWNARWFPTDGAPGVLNVTLPVARG